MFKKILIFILIIALILIISGCKESMKETEKIISEIPLDNSLDIPKEGVYVRYVELEEKDPYNAADSAEFSYIDEDIILEASNLIFKGVVTDELEIELEEYYDGELNYIYYEDVFTFEIEKIFYSEDPLLEVGDIIKVSNDGSSSHWWVTGALKMEKGKEYIVLTGKAEDSDTVEFSKYYNYYTAGYWQPIIKVENGNYYVDEGLSSLTGNPEEVLIREDGSFKTEVYVKGEELEDELEALILEKKGES